MGVEAGLVVRVEIPPEQTSEASLPAGYTDTLTERERER